MAQVRSLSSTQTQRQGLDREETSIGEAEGESFCTNADQKSGVRQAGRTQVEGSGLANMTANMIFLALLSSFVQ